MNVDLHTQDAAQRVNRVVSVCTGGSGLDLGVELAMPAYCPIAMVETRAHPPGLTRAFLGEAAPDWLVAACDAEQQARDERRERLKADLKRARAAL